MNESPAPTVSATGTLGVSWKETTSRSEHIAAVRSTSQDKHLQVIFWPAESSICPASRCPVAENTADGHQFPSFILRMLQRRMDSQSIFGIEPWRRLMSNIFSCPSASGIVSRKRLMVMQLVSCVAPKSRNIRHACSVPDASVRR